MIFHCFSGDAAMARDCVDAGLRAVLRRPGHASATPRELREAAALVPDEQLLVETDAPFLTPHPHRGRANEPYCLPWTVRGLAAAARRPRRAARRGDAGGNAERGLRPSLPGRRRSP